LKILVIDDDELYRIAITRALRNSNQDWKVFETYDADKALTYPSKLDLIILDNRYAGGSYWSDLLGPLRETYSSASIVLVSEVPDEELAVEVDNTSENTRALLGTDPFISFQPKSVGADGLPEHVEAIVAIAQSLYSKRTAQIEIEKLLLSAMMEAATVLYATKVGDLSKPSAGKADTKVMDSIAEVAIKRHVVPVMHKHEVVVCTEEIGSHNRLYHRVQAPEFFVFSDPLDGSSSFGVFAAKLCDQGYADLTLEEALSKPDLVELWHCGHRGLNSPMVSIVLAERHRVTTALLFNVFFGVFYASLTSGNWRCAPEASEDGGARFSNWLNLEALIEGNPEAKGWEQFEFRKEPSSSSEQLFLCQLSTRSKIDKGEKKPATQHSEICLSPLLPATYDWRQSFTLRYKQFDFTPGPGRVLFLAELSEGREYDRANLEGRSYDAVISCGEAITEWAGWLAFLRHANNMSLYCLRDKEAPISNCIHFRGGRDLAPMAPSQPQSMFREGQMDFMILHSCYASGMSTYKDTLVVAFENDPSWASWPRFGARSGISNCIKVPLF